MSLTPTFCGKDCGGNACPLMARVENGRVTAVTNNPAAGPYRKGCRRGFSMPLEAHDPGRLTSPLIRDGERGSGRFRQASWTEALDLVARTLGRIRDRHGASAVLKMGSAGCTSALHGTQPLLSRFLTLFGGCTRTAGSYSIGAAAFILPYVLGDAYTTAGWDAATMRRSRMIILWGANVLEARLGVAVDTRLAEAARQGARIVVLDPRRSPTARTPGAWWIPVRPATDAALMLAVLHVLITDRLVDRGFISAHSTGFDALERYVLGTDTGDAKTPGWASAICGVPAADIVRFAREYAAARPAMLLPGFSIQRVFAGEEPYRLSIALQVATGNFGVPGGSTGSLNFMLPPPRVGTLPVPAGPEQPSLPVVNWPDAVLEGKRGGYPSDIRAIYSVGSNYLNQGNHAAKSMRAFACVELAVCHDIFLTPTARACDVVLPAAHALEKEDIGLPWLGNFLTYKRPAVAPPGLARTDFDILADLADRMGFGREFTEGRTAAQWVQRFLDQSEVPDHDAFRETGIYIAPDQERVGLCEFSRDPAGHPLPTPSGKVEMVSRRYHEETGFPAIPTWQAPPEDPRFPLRLLTPKSLHRTHSQGGGVAEIRRRAAHALEMHPADAAARGIAEGATARIFNAEGQCMVPVRLSGDMAPGVVCLPEGAWLEPDAAGVDRGGCANSLTSTAGTAPGRATIMHGVGVQVEGA